MTKFIFITGNLSQLDIYPSRRLLKMCDIVLFLPVFKIFLLMTLKKNKCFYEAKQETAISLLL